jgi:hypothetical protein
MVMVVVFNSSPWIFLAKLGVIQSALDLLYPVTHYCIGLFASEVFSDIKAIVCMIEALNSFCGT